ncbi:UPF0481 protein At3g47200-like [Corylus avellana]|uniref:UPF0481 protein At3g47200-like n=1 Tax=Corylus avellana TaxID=13451 RepID=UPI00286C9FAD|nr:UPF0481 protein At3g47200-like [Corylus avellana]
MTGSKFGQGGASHVIDIPEEYASDIINIRDKGKGKAVEAISNVEENEYLACQAEMEEMLHKRNSLFTANDNDSCIFRLPHRFKDPKGLPYWPMMISIGLYCRDNTKLKKMEGLKWGCFEHLLKINDGCFIIEVIRYFYSVIRENREFLESHPLSSPRIDRQMFQVMCEDLLLLENQIPHVVLEKLFQISIVSWDGSDHSLSLIGKVFSPILGTPYEEDMCCFRRIKYLHLLNVVRFIFVQIDREKQLPILQDLLEGYWSIPMETILRISILCCEGIKFKPRKKDNLLEVEFLKGGEVEMQTTILHDLMCLFFTNCVALVQCHRYSSKHFSVQAFILDCLVNDATNVEFLCENGVIKNYIENDSHGFINNLGKGLNLGNEGFKIYKMCNQVNNYSNSRSRQLWTSFKNQYFGKPWLQISVLYAIALFVLTLLQTNYTIHPSS